MVGSSPARAARRVAALAVAAGDFVGEQHLEEVVVGQVPGAGQRETFGQRVE